MVTRFLEHFFGGLAECVPDIFVELLDLDTMVIDQAGKILTVVGSSFFRLFYKVTNALVAQTATQGAYPLALAAADPNAEPGAYYGPTRFGDARGPVGKSKVANAAKDEDVARPLWETTEALVGPFFS